MKDHDLTDQVFALLAGEDPCGLGERVLTVLVGTCNGRRAALYIEDDDRLAVVASKGADQALLDAASAVWRRHREALLAGERLSWPSHEPDRRDLAPVVTILETAVSFAAVPVTAADEVVGFLFFDSADSRLTKPDELDALSGFARLASRIVTAEPPAHVAAPPMVIEDYLERTPPEAVEREQLAVLLHRNEWNIARVARILGCTRRTIYGKLGRWGVARVKVRKTRHRALAG